MGIMDNAQKNFAKNSDENKLVRFGEQKGVDHLLGVEEVGYLLQMIEVSTHDGKHLDIALKCKLKLKAKLNNMMKVKE